MAYDTRKMLSLQGVEAPHGVSIQPVQPTLPTSGSAVGPAKTPDMPYPNIQPPQAQVCTPVTLWHDRSCKIELRHVTSDMLKASNDISGPNVFLCLDGHEKTAIQLVEAIANFQHSFLLGQGVPPIYVLFDDYNLDARERLILSRGLETVGGLLVKWQANCQTFSEAYQALAEALQATYKCSEEAMLRRLRTEPTK